LKLHLHSEKLVRRQRWRWHSTDRPSLDNLDLDQTRCALGYAGDRYREIIGDGPRAFHTGGYLLNPHTVVAMELGIEGMSNYRAADHRADASRDRLVNLPIARDPSQLSRRKMAQVAEVPE